MTDVERKELVAEVEYLNKVIWAFERLHIAYRLGGRAAPGKALDTIAAWRERKTAAEAAKGQKGQ